MTLYSMNRLLRVKPWLGGNFLSFNQTQHALLFNLEGKVFGYFSMKPERAITRSDKSGSPFDIKMGDPDDFPFVLEMYRTFSPKPASQGLPPEDPETCHNWLKELFEIGENVLAWRGDSVIGHAALVPDTKGRSCEFVIFVDQDVRNLGIGTELTRFAIEESRQRGFDSVWLTVNVTNFIAVKLYRKCGFEYCDMENYERSMRTRL
jgi:ribosomal protein S18 acetylase RimI-like enzyme